MSAVYNKPQFIAQFASLHHASTQPTLVGQLLTTHLPNSVSEYWILYDDFHRPVACAAANTVMSDNSVGYVGLFEAKDEQAGITVLKAATEWLQRGGLRQFEPVRQILGPVNMTTWLQYRLRVDEEPSKSMSFEPRHPQFYQACFEKAGFVKAADYYSTFFEIDEAINGYTNYVTGDTLEQHELVLQPWNTLDFAASLNPERHPRLSAEDDVAKRIYDLSIEMFRGKEFFDESLSREDHRRIVLNDMISRPEVDNASLLDLSSFLVDPRTGEDLGYLANWIENGVLVLKTVGVLDKIHKTKIYAIAVLETMQRAKAVWGCDQVTCALMNEVSVGRSERVGGKSVRHVYRLYMYRPTAVPASVSVKDHVSSQQPQQTITADSSLEIENHGKKQSLETAACPFEVSSSSPTTSLSAMQKEDQEKKARLLWMQQQRLKSLAQRSRGRVIARL
ncbi:hypothetical protein BGZ83_000762 [Gryganskiella cystojenkinii]|nr:hypothetical protein BGZ83_000762 [Gryganskiella cystojenkinii]